MDPQPTPPPLPPAPPPVVDYATSQTDGRLTGRQTYNVVADTVVGVNFRARDNIVQAIAVVGGLVLGAIVGALAVRDHLTGAIIGAFGGLLVGLFGSGIALMIYRGIRHARGRHD